MDQDWKPVIFKKKSTTLTKTTVARPKIHNPISSGVKLDENDEVSKIKYVPKEISNEITQARIFKKLTQKQLALGLNFKIDVINDIESGKAIYNGEHIARIRRYLGLIKK
jgi:ribosome-binding protein aMBF1 (putative translation factor)